jgi:hypothetical protein
MSRRGTAATGFVAMLIGVTWLAAPVSASPDNPCGLTFIPVCAFIPVLPSLDHDVDLTTNKNPPGPDSAGDAPAGVADPSAAQ